MNTIEYFRAWNDFEDADSHLMKLAGLLQSFAESLKTAASETCFVDIEEADRPALSELMDGDGWRATDFPTPAMIQLALRRRWFAHAKANSLWEEMSPAERKGAPSLRR